MRSKTISPVADGNTCENYGEFMKAEFGLI